MDNEDYLLSVRHYADVLDEEHYHYNSASLDFQSAHQKYGWAEAARRYEWRLNYYQTRFWRIMVRAVREGKVPSRFEEHGWIAHEWERTVCSGTVQ